MSFVVVRFFARTAPCGQTSILGNIWQMGNLAEFSWPTVGHYLVDSSGLSVVLYWWFVLLVPTLAILPWTARLTRGRVDGGYALAKVMGFLIPGYLVWLLASLRLVPFSRTAALAMAGWIVLAGAALAWKDRKSLRSAGFWKLAALEEAMFLSMLVLWGLLRYLRPDIQDIEKYMNFAFMNSVLQGGYMPPADPWFAGETINYYYFGHFISAYLVKLGGFVPAVGYNLMFATLPALAFMLTFAIVARALDFFRRQRSDLLGEASPRTMRGPVAGGLVSAILLTFAGNLHTIVYAVLPEAMNSLGLRQGPVTYWWSDPRSYIGYNPPTEDKTITEFPAYSFVLGDLHGHVMDLMFALTMVLVLLLFIQRGAAGGSTAGLGVPARRRIWGALDDLPLLLLMSLLIGVMAMTNTWDAPIYAGAAGLVFLIKLLTSRGVGAAERPLPIAKDLLKYAIEYAFVLALAAAVVSPWLHSFVSPTQGFHIAENHSPLWQLGVIYGLQIFLALVFVAAIIVEHWPRAGRRLPLAPADLFILILIATAVGCIVLPEIVYMKDIYGIEYHRSNTMFKFTFQAFALLWLASGYIVFRIESLAPGRWLKATLAGVLGVCLAMPLSFFYYAADTWYMNSTSTPSLDGLTWLRNSDPDDGRIIDFVNREAPRGNILEINGDPYSYTGRISMATGRPTVLGWRWHEKIWRFGQFRGVKWETDDPITLRSQEINDIYCSSDVGRTLELLEKYRIRYVIIGKTERQMLPSLNEAKLLGICDEVFRSGDSVVLQTPRTD